MSPKRLERNLGWYLLAQNQQLKHQSIGCNWFNLGESGGGRKFTTPVGFLLITQKW